VAVLALYLRTVYPSITGGDSGELVVTTCKLSIAHPPGYPLYTLLGWAWQRALDLLLQRHVHVAYAINCMSALLGALAAAALAHATSTLASRTPQASASGQSGAAAAGIYAGVGFACMPTVWLYSIQGEVFALNNALIALLVLLTVRYYTREERIDAAAALVGKSKKSDEGHAADANSSSDVAAAPPSRALVPAALFGAFVCGLCLTNQHTTVFPVLVTSAFITASLFTHGQLSGLRVVQLVGAVMLGMAPYAYIAIRAHWQVIDSWGDQRTLGGFLVHLLRQEYGTFQLAASEISEDPGMMSRLAVYATNLRTEMLFAGPLFALVGLVACLRSPSAAVRRASMVLSLSWLVYVLVFHKLANLDLRPLFLGVQARFWQQANLYLCLFAGVGVKVVADVIGAAAGKMAVHLGRVRVASVLAAGVCLASLGAHLHSNFSRLDHSGTTSFYQAGLAMLHSFPPGSLVLLNGDLNHNLVKYPHACEGVRPDLSLVSVQLMSWEWWVPMQRANYPNVTFPGVRYHPSTPRSFDIKRFLDANLGTTKGKRRLPGGVFLCGPFKDGDSSNVRSRDPATNWYEEHPFGLCNQLLPHGSKPANVSDSLRRGWGGMPLTRTLPTFTPERMGADTWEYVLYRDLWTRLVYLTSYASFHTNGSPGDSSLLALAKELTDELWANEQVLLEQGLIGTYEYRSAGVIYGMWAKHLSELPAKKHPTAAAEAARSRRLLWRRWLQYCLRSPDDNEIWILVRDRQDPYSAMTVTGLEEEDDWPSLQRQLEEATRNANSRAQAAAPQQQQQQAAASAGAKKAKKKKQQGKK